MDLNVKFTSYSIKQVAEGPFYWRSHGPTIYSRIGTPASFAPIHTVPTHPSRATNQHVPLILHARLWRKYGCSPLAYSIPIFLTYTATPRPDLFIHAIRHYVAVCTSHAGRLLSLRGLARRAPSPACGTPAGRYSAARRRGMRTPWAKGPPQAWHCLISRLPFPEVGGGSWAGWVSMATASRWGCWLSKYICWLGWSLWGEMWVSGEENTSLGCFRFKRSFEAKPVVGEERANPKEIGEDAHIAPP